MSTSNIIDYHQDKHVPTMHQDQSALIRYIHIFIYDDPSPAGGGTQNMAYWLACGLKERGLRVVIAGQKEFLERPAFNGKGIEFFKLNHPFRSKYSTDIRLLCLLIRLRIRYGREVIAYSLVINNIRIIRWLNRWLGWQCVSFLHGNETLRLLAKRPAVLRKNIMACACVFANSQYSRSIAERIQPFSNIEVIPPGIPVSDFSQPQNDSVRKQHGWKDRKIILMLSRLTKRKGHQTVIEAIAKLRHKYPELLLVIAGTGGYRGEIERLIKEHHVQDHVVMLGFASETDKLALYDACDVYCMPSDIDESNFEVEGFGITFIEAAARGRLAIGSKSGGIPDAIVDGKSGFLISPGDTEALYKLLDNIFSRPQDFNAMRHYALERARLEFDWSRCIDRILIAMNKRINPGN